MDLICHIVDSNPGHTAMIDWTFPEHTGRAFDRVTDYPVMISEGRSGGMIGGAEDGDNRHVEGGGDMHGMM